jgi:hypothetical protein
MAILYKSNIDLGGLALQKAALHPASTAPTGPSEGQVYWNTGDDKLYVHNGSSWIDVSGDVRQIDAGTGISVTGGSGGTAEVSFSHLGLETLTAISSENADAIFFYDVSSTSAAYLTCNTTSGIEISGTSLQLSSIPNASLANSSITITGGDGLTATAGATSLGGTTTVAVGEGTGIDVTADAVSLKNHASLSDNTIQMWDDTNGQLVDSSITDDGTDVNIGTDSNTRNLVVSGNLTVSGSSTTVDSNTVNIGDSILTLNADILSTASPSEDGGITIDRGASPDRSILWREGNDYWEVVGQFAIDNMPQITSVPAASKFLIATGSDDIVKHATLGDVSTSLGIGNHSILLDAANRDNVQKTGNVYSVNHGLGSKYVKVEIMDATTFETVMVETTRYSDNVVKVHFAQTVTDGDYICMTTLVGNVDTADVGAAAFPDGNQGGQS